MTRWLNMSLMESSPRELTFNTQKGPDARDRILSAALSLFAMRGFEGVSTTQIAKVAGITQPLIHYHFKNKEALWKATVAKLFGTLNDEFSAAIKDLPRQDKKRYLVEVIRNYVGFAAKYPEFGQFIMREGAQGSDRLDWLVKEWMRPAMNEFYDLYLEGVSDGWLKAIPFPQLVMMVTAAATNFFSLGPLVKSLYDVEASSPEQVLAHSDAIVEMVVSALVKQDQAVSANARVV